jgi:hypothetical protein
MITLKKTIKYLIEEEETQRSFGAYPKESAYVTQRSFGAYPKESASGGNEVVFDKSFSVSEEKKKENIFCKYCNVCIVYNNNATNPKNVLKLCTFCMLKCKLNKI